MAEPRASAASRAGARSSWSRPRVVAVVLGAAVLTGLLPTPIQEVVFHTPLAIVVLIVGTGWLLWRISRRSARPTTAGDRAGAAPATRRATARAPRGPTSRARRHETWDVVIVGGGIVGAGALLDAVVARAAGRTDRAGRHRRRARRRARRGSSTAACATSSSSGSGSSARRSPSGAGCCASRRTSSRIEPLLFPIYGIPFLSQGVLRRRADPVRRPRRPPRRRLAPAAVERPTRSTSRRRCGATGLRGGLALPRRRRGRRAIHAGRRPDRAGRRARRSASPGSGRRARDGRRVGTLDAVLRATRRPSARRPRDPDPGGRRCDRRLGGRARASVRAAGRLRILPSRGAHLVVPRERIPSHDRPDDPRPGQGRVPRPVAGPLADRHDRRAVRRPARPARRRRLGGRPAAGHGQRDARRRPAARATSSARTPASDRSSRRRGGSTVKASREHRVTVESNGVVRIGGGKYTTYRVMARDVIDAVLGREARHETRPSATAERRLVGRGRRRRAGPASSAELETIPAVAAAHPEAAARLVGAARDRSAGRRRARRASWTCSGRWSPGRPFLEAEVAWAVAARARAVARRRPVAPAAAQPGAGRSRRRRSRRGWPRSWAPSSAGATPRQALEVEAYLATARREYAVAPSPPARVRRSPRRRSRRTPQRADGASSAGHARRPRSAAMPSIGDLERLSHGPLRAPDPGRDRVDRLAFVRPGRPGPSARLVRGRASPSAARPARLAARRWRSALPVGWYLGSPIFIRTSLVEPEPAAVAVDAADADRRPPSGVRRRRPRRRGSIELDRRPPPTPRADAVRAHDGRDRRVPRDRRLPFRPRDGVDHRGRARSISTSASTISRSATARTCTCTCRRTPTATPTARSSSGRSRRPTARSATTCPPAPTRPTSRSALIWCKQFSHLFAVGAVRAG